MNFIKVIAVSNPPEDRDDRSSATFYLNVDMIKLITLDGSIHLKTIPSDSEEDILWDRDLEFTKIKIHPDVSTDFWNNLQQIDK